MQENARKSRRIQDARTCKKIEENTRKYKKIQENTIKALKNNKSNKKNSFLIFSIIPYNFL